MISLLYLIILYNHAEKLPHFPAFVVKCSVRAKDSVQRYERPENAIYAGFLGDATLFSLNYESLTVLNDALILSARLGFGFNEEFDLCLFGGCDEPDKYFVIPHHITINLGHRQSFFEAGLGGAYIPKLYAHPYYLFPMFGYRFIPVKKLDLFSALRSRCLSLDLS